MIRSLIIGVKNHNKYEHYKQYAHIDKIKKYAHIAHMKKEDEKLTQRVQFLTAPSMVKAIDDYRFKNRHRTQGETIRKLIELGLEKNEK